MIGINLGFYIFRVGIEGILGRQEKKIISYVRSYKVKFWEIICIKYISGVCFIKLVLVLFKRM